MSIQRFDERLARERRARLQAERLLAQRSAELYAAHKKLADHAHALSHTVIAQREVNAALIGQSTQTQAALDVATEKAGLAERRLWDALSSVEDGFAMFDRDWRLVLANPAWMSAFDGALDVAPGASCEAILRIAADEGLVDLEGERPEDWIDRMIARWEAPNIPQIDLRLFNGTYVRLIDKRTPEGDMVSLAVDITDTIRRERELERALDEAEAAARAKSTFLANMSHEIRTPMNGVVSMADLLRETALTEDQRLYADTIRNSGEALLVIINDILDYSKIDAGKLVLHPESFDLQHLIHEIFQLMRPGLEGKALELRLDYDIFLPERMIGDRGRIRQILTNLIGNAVKFTESGHVAVRVVGAPRDHPPGTVPINVLVEDTGIGIAPDMQAHVFGEFNQVESEASRRFDGTGLGLSITRKLVAMMNGDVWLSSEPGVGSIFGFSLPLGADPAAQDQPVAPLPEARAAVWAITGGVGLPDIFVSHLMRLRARLTETPDLAGAPAGAAAVMLAGCPADVTRWLAALRERGHSGPILYVEGAGPRGDGGGGGPDLPPGVRSIAPTLPLADLRAALLPEDAARPANPDQGHDLAPAAVLQGHFADNVDAQGALASDGAGGVPAPVAKREAEPLAPVAAQPPAGTPPGMLTAPFMAQSSLATPKALGRLRVLAAEDNKTNRLVFCTMLKGIDMDLEVVENGAQCVAAFRVRPPDLIFTDISMPEMDGIEAARAIRALEVAQGLPRVPIVAMTAHAMEGDRERILAAGIDAYMTKPLKKAELHGTIRAHAPPQLGVISGLMDASGTTVARTPAPR